MPKAIVENKEKKSPKETYYLLIVDSSASMSSLTKSTISGINEQIDTIKQLEKDYPNQVYKMSFIHFNNKITIEYTERSASELQHITENNYLCNGMTALLDAIGVGVNALNDSISDKIVSGEASAVVVIITDGEENSSREYDIERVKSIISELQNTNSWTFTFVGANIDSISTAKSFGINTNNVMQFSADMSSNSRVYRSMAKSFNSRAASLDMDMYSSKDFLCDEDKDLTTKQDKDSK